MPSVPYTFTANTTIESAKVNANFQALEGGLTTSGGEMSGGFTVDTDNTYDLGTSTKGWRALYLHSLKLFDTDSSHTLAVEAGSNLTANRTLTVVTGDANRTLTLSGDVTLSGTPYTVAGTDVALADGGTGASLSDPGADRIMFWDDSDGAVTWLTLGTGLSITGTTINASAGLSVTGTDNHLVRMDGTSGLQSSGITVDDSDNVSGVAALSFGTTATFSRTSKSLSTAYLAASDGLLVVYIDALSVGGIGYVSVLSDASNPPTTLIAQESGQNDYRMVVVPIKKTDYYKVNQTTNSGTINTTVTWVPFGING